MPGGTLRYKGRDEPHQKKRRRTKMSDEATADQTPARPAIRTRLDTYSHDQSLYDDDDDHRPSATSPAQDDDFNERLFEAMREDEGLDAIAGFYAAGSSTAHLPQRWRADTTSSYRTAGPSGIVSTDRLVHSATGVVLNAHIFDLKDAYDDDTYAEHIRTGMYRRTHAEEIRRQEAAEKDRRDREAKLKAERKATRKAEANRLRHEESEAKRLEAEASLARRLKYDTAWRRLVSLPVDQPLRSPDFVWPIGPGEPLDSKHISRFLLDHLPPKDRRRALRAPLLAYHPDRFNRLVHRVPSMVERESVMQTGLRVSQLLNDLLAIS